MFAGTVVPYGGPMIAVEGLTVHDSGTTAVDHLSFEVTPGVVTATGFLSMAVGAMLLARRDA